MIETALTHTTFGLTVSEWVMVGMVSSVPIIILSKIIEIINESKNKLLEKRGKT